MSAHRVPRDVSPGQIIAGKYRVERVIAAGGQGTVVEAMHLRLKQPVAIKFPHLAGDDILGPVERMFREARAAFRLHGEHVARTIDVDVVRGAPFIVMEYLRGVDLKAYLAERGPLPIDEAVGLLLQACEAVAEAHDQGIVHRDLKPSNMFLVERPGGSPMLKVLDFGLSKAESMASPVDISDLTEPERMLGTPRYMSPEQVRDSRDVDGRSDIWSLGVIFQEMLTGAPMFRARTASEALAMVATRSPAPVSLLRSEVPPEIERAVLRCLQKLREHRFSTVRELAHAVAAYAPVWAVGNVERLVPGTVRRDEPAPARVTAPRPAVSATDAAPSRTRARRLRPALLLAAAAATVFVVGGASAWTLGRSRLRGLPAVAPGDGAAGAPLSSAERRTNELARPPVVRELATPVAPVDPWPEERERGRVMASDRPAEDPAKGSRSGALEVVASPRPPPATASRRPGRARPAPRRAAMSPAIPAGGTASPEPASSDDGPLEGRK